MYKLADEKKRIGYKGKVLTNENVNSFPERLLKIWEKAKFIKLIRTSSTKKEEKK